MVLPRLSVVIVNHHRPDLLADALRALYASERRPDEIVVVETDAAEAPSLPADDGESAIPVRLLVLPDNPGYAAACNRGAAQASGDWVLFMNADVNVSPECLAAVLTEASADPGIGIATCRLVRPDGNLDHACHRGIPASSIRSSTRRAWIAWRPAPGALATTGCRGWTRPPSTTWRPARVPSFSSGERRWKPSAVGTSATGSTRRTSISACA